MLKMSGLPKYRALHQNVVHGNFNDITPLEISEMVVSPCMRRSLLHSVESQLEREDNATRLLILSILSNMFEVEKMKLIENQNHDVYIMCQKLLADEALFMLLVEYLKSEDRFLIHASSKCLGSLVGSLDDEVLLKKRCKLLLEICLSTDAVEERNIYFLVFSHILSQRNSTLSAKNTILSMLQIDWEHFLNKTISKPFYKLDSGDNVVETYSADETMPLLILWKKIIKCEIAGRNTSTTKGQPEAVTALTLLNKKPFLLLNYFEIRHDHLALRKVFDILTTSFGPYEFMDRQQEQCCCLAESFLQKVLHGVLGSLPNNFRNIGFGGSSFVEAGDGNGGTCDFVLLRKVCLAVLKCAAVHNQRGNHSEAVLKSLKILEEYFQMILPLPDASLKLSIFHLFVEQDDGLIAAILLALFVYQQLGKKQNGVDEDVINSIKPHEMFLEFLENVSFDHSILLDYLTSPETCFLTYLTKYLQLMAADWDRFIKTTKKYFGKLVIENESDGSADAHIDDSESGVSYQSQDSKLDGHFSAFLAKGEQSLRDCPGSSFESQLDVHHSETALLPAKLQGNVLGLVAYSSSNSDSEFPGCESTDDLGLEKIQLSDSASADNKLTQSKESERDVEFKIPTPCFEVEDLEKEESMSESSIGELSKLSADDFQEEGGCMLSNNILDQTMATLIRLRMAVERLYSNDLFPYNPTVLLNLIETCEDLYEN
ncbi:protein Lines homolog 1-like [Lineus longissimus]|uniref:protein Lines homolog 1-like n=1 Tax=Lineus longissimus TaxID=88925 RepID=UPI00315DDCC0